MVLLDTHCIAWALLEERRLSKAATAAVLRGRREGTLAISAISVYELASLIQSGKLQTPGTLQESLRRLTEDFYVRPVTGEIAVLAAQFPSDFPRDPGDRIIAATARAEDCPLVTADTRIQRSKLVKTIW